MLALDFSDSEVQLYKRRLEEGYDLDDERYQQWLRSTTSISVTSCSSPLPYQSTDLSVQLDDHTTENRTEGMRAYMYTATYMACNLQCAM